MSMELSGVGTLLPVDALVGAASAPVIEPSRQAIERAFDQIFIKLLWQGAAGSEGLGWGSTGERSTWDGLISATMVSALSETGKLGLGQALYAQLYGWKEGQS
jgi:hypothetical protein